MAAILAAPRTAPAEPIAGLGYRPVEYHALDHEILTPQQCIERARNRAADFSPCLHPLAGGIPVERAWRGLKLYVDEVLGVLLAE